MSLIYRNIVTANHLLRNRVFLQSALRLLSDNVVSETDTKLGGFAKAFERHSAPQIETPVQDNQTFASLLRNSKFVDVSLGSQNPKYFFKKSNKILKCFQLAAWRSRKQSCNWKNISHRR